MRSLAGGVAILTGASRGLGIHIARALAKEGMNLVLAARSLTELEDVRTEVQRLGVKAVAISTDVRDPSALRALVAHAQSEFVSIDVLVNNAAIELTLKYDKLTPDEIEDMIRVNLTGAMILAWLVLPGMLARKRGHIVNMSSLAGKAGPPCTEPYAATKAGLIAFTQSLRATYRGTGVSASVVCPGFVEEGMYARAKAEFGVAAPRLLGSSTAAAVAHGVLRAIHEDLPEVIVNPRPTRPLFMLATLSPRLGEWLARRVGTDDFFRKSAKLREHQRETAR